MRQFPYLLLKTTPLYWKNGKFIVRVSCIENTFPCHLVDAIAQIFNSFIAQNSGIKYLPLE